MPRPPWWQPSLSLASDPGPDKVTLRPCGCRIDPIVFGCPHAGGAS